MPVCYLRTIIDLSSVLSHVYVRVSNHKCINVRPILETWVKVLWRRMASRRGVFSFVTCLDDITTVLLLYKLCSLSTLLKKTSSQNFVIFGFHLGDSCSLKTTTIKQTKAVSFKCHRSPHHLIYL